MRSAASLPALSLDQALDDPHLFAPHFRGPSWAPWRTILRAIEASPPRRGDRKRFRELTAREGWPSEPAREVWIAAGRRGGKTRAMALLAVHRAAFIDYSRYLAPGERATVMLLACDRTQARVAMRYVGGLLHAVPLLERMIEREAAEAIDLSNRTTIEIHTASFRATRGYTLAAVVADEVAFWRSDETSANPAAEILAALRPGLATIPGAPLLAISSPYSRSGPLWEAYRRHYGKPSDVLVVKAPTRALNPTIPQELVDRALEEDPEAAAAEYLAEFRRDVSTFLAREAIEACVTPGRRELPPMAGTSYVAFCDPSGGSSDAMTLAIAHAEGRGDELRAVLDAVREVRPPFSPDAVVREFAELLRAYRIETVRGDRYGGEWPAERFRVHGIEYRPADLAKSDLYRELLAPVNAGRVELLDLPRLVGQLAGLERRVARGGRDSIDHAPGAHDDVANAVAGALIEALRVGALGDDGNLEVVDLRRPSPWSEAWGTSLVSVPFSDTD